MSKQFKFMLDESNIPKAWYNINADMPVHLAPGVASSNQKTCQSQFSQSICQWPLQVRTSVPNGG